jgi:RND superfamily putative drug exporter
MTRRPRNIAYSMGRWSGLHPWRAILGWLAFVVIAVVLGGAVGTKELEQSDIGAGESGRAAKVLDEAGFNDLPATESVLIQSRTGPLDRGTLATVSADVSSRLGELSDVTKITSPMVPSNGHLLSADGRSALVQFDIKGDAEKAVDKVEPILAAVAESQKAHPEVRVEQFGEASAGKAIEDMLASDFKKAEQLSIPVTLVILLVAFGALLAAGIPVLLGLSSVFASIGLLGVASQITPVSESASIVMMLLGMAVGVDYSLFYLKREREERAAGRGPQAALEAAAATSGRAVLISGFTVMVAQAGLFLSGDVDSYAMAMGSILVVGVAMIGSLTVLPAILAKLGHRVHKSRIPFLSRLRRGDGDSRIWGFVLGHVLRRPKLALTLSVGALVALAIPVLSLQTKTTGLDDLPRSLPAMQTYDRVEAAFPSESFVTADVVVRAADVRAPQVADAVERLKTEAVATGRVQEPIETTVNPAGTVAEIVLPIVGNGTDDASMQALATVRDEVVPATLGSVAGVEANVGGSTAMTKDFNDRLTSHAPYIFGFVVVAAFLLLLVTFRSVVIPIKAIVLNLLSVGASYGLLSLIFQHGWGVELLGGQTGGIVSWLPLFLFVLLFGLSMDYHVFILSRIKELYDNGMTNDEAVEHGIKSSAGVVSAAAIVMVAVFSIFATLTLVDLKQFGVGMAFAILLDATIIRGVVLPASMKLLGDWNWWMPRSLGWVPTIDHGTTPEAAAQG